MHAHGVSLADLGVGQSEFTPEQSRNAFRILCSHWKAYRGTPVKFWFESELADIFGIDLVPSEETADAIYDAHRRRAQDPGVPAAGAVRTVRHRVHRHHRRPLRRPAPPPEARRPTRRGQGTVAPTFRPGQVPRAGHPGVERPGRHPRRGLRRRHRHVRRVGRRDGGPARLLQGQRRGLHRPLAPRRPRRAPRRCRGRAPLRAGPRRDHHRRAGSHPAPRTSCSSRPGWPPRTAWS